MHNLDDLRQKKWQLTQYRNEASREFIEKSRQIILLCDHPLKCVKSMFPSSRVCIQCGLAEDGPDFKHIHPEVLDPLSFFIIYDQKRFDELATLYLRGEENQQPLFDAVANWDGR